MSSHSSNDRQVGENVVLGEKHVPNQDEGYVQVPRSLLVQLLNQQAQQQGSEIFQTVQMLCGATVADLGINSPPPNCVQQAVEEPLVQQQYRVGVDNVSGFEKQLQQKDPTAERVPDTHSVGGFSFTTKPVSSYTGLVPKSFSRSGVAGNHSLRGPGRPETPSLLRSLQTGMAQCDETCRQLACLGDQKLDSSHQLTGSSLTSQGFLHLDEAVFRQQYGVFDETQCNQVELEKRSSSQCNNGSVCGNFGVANIGEADEQQEGSSISWNTSQLVNDALSNFQHHVQQEYERAQDDYLSVTGSMPSQQSLLSQERAELDHLREVFARLNLGHHVQQPVQQQQQPVQQQQQHVQQRQQPVQPSVTDHVFALQQGSHMDGVGTAVGEAASGSAPRQPTLVPREVKLAKPSTFSGKKSEVDNFIFEMRQYVDSVGLGTEGTACRFVVSHLKGDALTWWRSYSGDSTRVFEQLQLEDLLDELKNHFSDVDEEMKLRDKLLSLRQTGNVAGFVNEFKQLQLKLGRNRLPDEIALHVFLVGLKNFTRQMVMLQRPDSLEDAILLAERAEQSLFWQRDASSRGRTFYRNGKEDVRTVSQYSNSRYRGTAPMVLGNVTKSSQLVGKAEVTCYHCGKKGHYKRECYKLHGKPSSKPGQKSGPKN